MAYELEVSQSNYGRLEKDDSRLTVPKIQKISEILNVSISVLFGEKATNIVYENNGNAQNGTIIYNEINHINSLKEEIVFLRSIIDGNKNKI